MVQVYNGGVIWIVKREDNLFNVTKIKGCIMRIKKYKVNEHKKTIKNYFVFKIKL